MKSALSLLFLSAFLSFNSTASAVEPNASETETQTLYFTGYESFDYVPNAPWDSQIGVEPTYIPYTETHAAANAKAVAWLAQEYYKVAIGEADPFTFEIVDEDFYTMDNVTAIENGFPVTASWMSHTAYYTIKIKITRTFEDPFI